MNTILKMLLIGVNFFKKLISPHPKEKYIQCACYKCNRTIYLSKEYIGTDSHIPCKRCGNNLNFGEWFKYKDIPPNSEIKH